MIFINDFAIKITARERCLANPHLADAAGLVMWAGNKS